MVECCLVCRERHLVPGKREKVMSSHAKVATFYPNLIDCAKIMTIMDEGDFE